MNLVEYAVNAPAALPPDAYTGWIKDYCDWVRPSTDAGIEGMFATASVNVGLAIGRTINVYIGFPHYANLYVVLLGLPGVPRKTTLLTRAESIRTDAFAKDAVVTVTGIGSGEGLLEAFCEVVIEGEGRRQKEVLRPRPGQIVLLDENELTSVFHKGQQQATATLYDIIIKLYDSKDLTPRTRQRSIRVIRPFFSIISATTPQSLMDAVKPRDLGTGFLPRFATFHCTRRTPMASPPEPNWGVCSQLAAKLRDISAFAAEYGDRSIPTSEAAVRVFGSYYADLCEAAINSDRVSHIIERIHTQIRKWSLIYAVQECATVITTEHMERAIIVGQYLEACAKFAYSALGVNPITQVVQKVIEKMATYPDGTFHNGRTIHRWVSGDITADVLRRELDANVTLGTLLGETAMIRGRPVPRYALPWGQEP